MDLPPQPARLLALLTRSPGRIVSRDRIQEEVWSDTVVEFDQAINNAVRQVRDALGDDASDPRYIETVPRRGYRFIAPVEAVRGDAGSGGLPAGSAPPEDAEPGGATATAGRTRRWSLARFGALTAISIGVGVALWVALAGGPQEQQAIVIAVVPARATTAGSPADTLADSLTAAMMTALEAVDPVRLRVIPWGWDMSLDPETGEVSRGGEPVAVDIVADINVHTADDGACDVTVSLTTLPGRHQAWYRRFEGLPRGHAATATVTDGVVEAVRENIEGLDP